MRTPISKIRDIEINKEYTNNAGDKFKVIRIYSDNTADIEFTDENRYTYLTDLTCVRRGQTKNPYRVATLGVGFIGDGPFRSHYTTGSTIEYVTWLNILAACYDPYFINNKPRTMNHIICDEWKNFQVFAKWLVGLGYYDTGVYTINQTLLGRGSLVYSPDTVCYIPICLRNHLVTKWNQGTGKYPQGVKSYSNQGRFSAIMNAKGYVRIGVFDTVEEAAQAYKNAKEAYVKEVANLHQHELEPRVYEALMNWEYIEVI